MFAVQISVDCFVERPRVEWYGHRPFAFARLPEDYARTLEELALAKEEAIKNLPVSPGWEADHQENPTTARYASYSTFLISPLTVPLFFAIRLTYLHLLRELSEPPADRLIQCWYNVHRAGLGLTRHAHDARFMGTFSAHASGSQTRYGEARRTSEWDMVFDHVPGRLLVTTAVRHFHETSIWTDPERPRVTYAFDIIDASDWRRNALLLPFDSRLTEPVEPPAA
jgi:hypothetical protein